MRESTISVTESVREAQGPCSSGPLTRGGKFSVSDLRERSRHRPALPDHPPARFPLSGSDTCHACSSSPSADPERSAMSAHAHQRFRRYERRYRELQISPLSSCHDQDPRLPPQILGTHCWESDIRPRLRMSTALLERPSSTARTAASDTASPPELKRTATRREARTTSLPMLKMRQAYSRLRWREGAIEGRGFEEQNGAREAREWRADTYELDARFLT